MPRKIGNPGEPQSAYLVAQIAEDGSVKRIEVVHEFTLRGGERGEALCVGEWPVKALLGIFTGANYQKAAAACVTWLRLTRPAWARYLASRPTAVPMRDLQGHAQAPKAWANNTIKRPSARAAR